VSTEAVILAHLTSLVRSQQPDNKGVSPKVAADQLQYHGVGILPYSIVVHYVRLWSGRPGFDSQWGDCDLARFPRV
jgi:hypothetical protein